MTWAKLSDDFSDDCWTLDDAEFRLHTEALVWSNRKLLNCIIPKDDVRRFAKRPEAMAGLIAKGYWRDAGENVEIVHHAMYQRERDAVLKQQEANRKNGAKGGRPAKVGREANEKAITELVSESVTQSVSSDGETQSVSESKTERDRTGQASRTGDPSEVDWKMEISSATTFPELDSIHRRCPEALRPAVKARAAELNITKPAAVKPIRRAPEPVVCTRHQVPGCTLRPCRQETGAVA